MTAYPCARCGDPYDQDGRRRSMFCPSCRDLNQREKRVERDRERNARRHDVTDVLNEYTRQGMTEDYVDMMRHRAEDYLDAAEQFDNVDRVAAEQPIEGANSPAGPEDGTSTYFTDLADELDAAHDAVALHPWWVTHPNWYVGIHDDGPIPTTAYLNAS